MALSDKTSSNSDMTALNQTKELQTRHDSAIFDSLPMSSAALPGIGFENPPPLAILFKPFNF